jgi:hypothetical protein
VAKTPPQLKETMTKTKLYLLAVITAALSLNNTTTIGQPIDSTESLKNRAVAASPRAIEVFPWLARNWTQPIRSTGAVTRPNTRLAEVKGNRALAASPRMKELFPELARPAMSSSETAVATRSGINPLAEVTRNPALAASPRMREVFPELTRGAEKSIEVAPLK